MQRNGAHLFAHGILYGNQALIQDGMHVFADRTLRIGMFVKMKQILFFFYRFKDVQQRDLLWIVRQGGAAFSGSDMNDAGSFQLSQRIADDDRMVDVVFSLSANSAIANRMCAAIVIREENCIQITSFSLQLYRILNVMSMITAERASFYR